MIRLMRRAVYCAIALPATFAAAPALAHPGHITDVVAGHDHWVAGIALGVAAGIAVIGAIKSIKGSKGDGARETEGASDADAPDDAEPQEA